ncbi:S8 family serine peptidase [Chloroflexi bacterium TSY]|nr:S8 family serine peptidase [Chloroflexi bacterium TSY]
MVLLTSLTAVAAVDARLEPEASRLARTQMDHQRPKEEGIAPFIRQEDQDIFLPLIASNNENPNETPPPTLTSTATVDPETTATSTLTPILTSTATRTTSPTPTPTTEPPPRLANSTQLYAYPRIERAIEPQADQKVQVTYQVYNNVGRSLRNLALTYSVEANAGTVQPVSIDIDAQGIFSATQSGGPDAVVCTFVIATDQQLAPEQVAKMNCVYQEDDRTVARASDQVLPEPFIADTNFDQMHDRLAESIAVSNDEEIEILVMLTRPVMQTDKDLFLQHGGTIETELPLIDGFMGTMPADRILDYHAAVVDLDFIEPNLSIGPALDIATRNTRANRVWQGDTSGMTLPMTNTMLAFMGDPLTSIAIVDTGLDASHTALGPFQDVSTLVGGWGALNAGTKIVGWQDFDPRAIAAPLDAHGHGSHVAGIAAGSGGGAAPAGQDMRGVAYNARLVGVRLAQVSTSSTHTTRALNWLRGQLATYHVVAVNQSYRSFIPTSSSRAWGRASQALVQAGVVLINAAGNEFADFDGGGVVSTPGNMPKVLTVGAVNDADQISHFSSNGDPLYRVTKPDVVAPGGTWVIDNNFNWTAQMLSVDSNHLEPFLDLDADGVHDPGDGCRDLNRNGQLDSHLDIFLDQDGDWRYDAGEPWNNWNGTPGFQAGGDACVDTHASPPVNQLTGELWLDVNRDGVYNGNGVTPGRHSYRAMVGTSQAAPIVAGEVALIVDAMTDYSDIDTDDEGGADEDRWDGIDNDNDDIIDEDPGEWVYQEQFARLVKSIVLMATYEVAGGETVPAQWLWFDENGDGVRQFGSDEVIRDVAPLNQIYDAGRDVVISQGADGATNTANGTSFSRNDNNPLNDPWFKNAGATNNPRAGKPNGGWDRGGKDVKEGYGRVAIDAALEAVSQEFCAMETDRFGAGLTDKKVWARHLHLYAGKEYKLKLEGPGGADYDLYLYQGTPDNNGDPVIAKKAGSNDEIKAIAANTANEEIEFKVRQDGLYFLIVRRVTGAGQFTIRLITPEEWTLMVYMPAELEGGRDLDALAAKAINDLEQTGSGEESMKEFQVLVLVDYDQRAWDGKDGSEAGEPDHRGDAVLYCIRKDHDDEKQQYSIAKQPSEVLTLVNPGTATQRAEVNMGDPDTLKKFMAWGVDYFPAKKYGLILWGDGRGYGWKVNPEKALGPGNDNKRTVADAADAKFDALEMYEIKSALADVKKEINEGSQYKPDDTKVAGNLHLLGFDMGHMALIEVGRQAKDSVDVMVASEERIMDDGWPYQEFLTGLNCERQADGWNCDKVAQMDAAGLSQHAVNVYGKYYTSDKSDPKHTLSAVQLSGGGERIRSTNAASAANGCNTFDALLGCVSAFGAELRTGVEDIQARNNPNDNVQIKIKHEGREATEEMEDHNYIDLRHFAEKIQALSVPIQYKGQTQPIVDGLAVGAGIVLSQTHGSSHPNSHGMTIYFPHDQLLPEDASCKDAPDAGDRTCGFDNPLPSQVIYAKDDAILIAKLRQPDDSHTHPRPEINAQFRFPQESQWDEFLHRYYKPVADACIIWAGGCFDFAVLEVGETVTLSGAGSSDSDGRAGDDIPQAWYWDLDTTVDIPAPKPTYPMTSTVLFDDPCTEDCDRDDNDSSSDDPNAQGQTVEWTCPEPGDYSFNLMVHDEHNDEGQVHNEEYHHVHWKLDTKGVGLTCVAPIKVTTQDVAIPSQPLRYSITVHGNPTLTGPATGTMSDPLPDNLDFMDNLNCSSGTCDFDPETRTVAWEGELTSDSEVTIEFDAVVPSESVPLDWPDIVNRIEIFDGVALYQAEDVTPVQCVPVKRAEPQTVTPGQPIRYTIAAPLHPELTVATDVIIQDQLPDIFQGVANIDCMPQEGSCGFDQESRMVFFNGTLAPGEQAILEFDAIVQENIPPSSCPPQIVNQAVVFDGKNNVPITTSTQLDCGTPTTE